MGEIECSVIRRTCTKCGQNKELECFTKATRGKYGRSSRCRLCDKAYYEENKTLFFKRSLARYHRLQAPKREKKALEKAEFIAKPDKRCSKCKLTIDKCNFGKDSNRRDGLKPYCKACRANEFSDRVMRRGRNKKSDAWRGQNPEKSKEISKRHASKIHNRIHHSISSRIYQILCGKDGKTTEELLGYSSKELMNHLEAQFLPGMNWSNYGKWHVDHIRPLSSFKIESVDDPQIRIVWGLANLRPLWAKENFRKNAKMIYLL